jgi:hypothetical protein
MPNTGGAVLFNFLLHQCGGNKLTHKKNVFFYIFGTARGSSSAKKLFLQLFLKETAAPLLKVIFNFVTLPANKALIFLISC